MHQFRAVILQPRPPIDAPRRQDNGVRVDVGAGVVGVGYTEREGVEFGGADGAEGGVYREVGGVGWRHGGSGGGLGLVGEGVGDGGCWCWCGNGGRVG